MTRCGHVEVVNMRCAAIRAVASYLPPVIEQNDLSSKAVQTLGIVERHKAAPDQACSDLACAAADKLFARLPKMRGLVDFVLLCTQQPDYPLPTTACLVAERLGLPRTVGALDYNLGCSGYVYGLALAKGLVEAGLAEHVLLLTAVVVGPSVSPDDEATWPLFADGASATLIDAVDADRPSLDAFVFGTDGELGPRLLVQEVGGSRCPWMTTDVQVVNDAYGQRTTAHVYMNGAGIARFTLTNVPPLVDSVLRKAGLERRRLDQVVFHQPNKGLLRILRKRCGLLDTPFFDGVEHTGNIGSSSIPWGIEQVLAQRSPSELRRTLLAGFGVGLSWAGCVADLSHVVEEDDQDG